MRSIEDILISQWERLPKSRYGRSASSDECAIAAAAFQTLVPEWYWRLLQATALVDSTLLMPRGDWNPSLDIAKEDWNFHLDFLSPADMLTEAYDMYPGINIIKMAYVPIAGCGEGGGDPFCCRFTDDAASPIIQVDHELPDGFAELPERGYWLVAKSLSDLFQQTVGVL